MCDDAAAERVATLTEVAHAAWLKSGDETTPSREATTILQAMLAARGDDAAHDRDLIRLCTRLGPRLIEFEDVDRGRGLLDAATTLLNPLQAARPADLDVRLFRFEIAMAASVFIFGYNDSSAAERSLAAAVEVAAQTSAEHPLDEAWGYRLFQAQIALAEFCCDKNLLSEAQSPMRDALAQLDRMHATGPGSASLEAMVLGYCHLGTMFSGMGRWPQARHCATRCAPMLPAKGYFFQFVKVDDRLAIAAKLLEDDPSHPEWEIYFVGTSGNGYHSSGFGNTRLDLPPPDALAVYESDLARLDGHFKRNHPNHTRDVSLLQERIGHLALARGDVTKAFAAFEASESLREALVRSDPNNAGWQRDLVIIKAKVGLAAQSAALNGRAQDAFRSGRAIVAGLMATDPSLTSWAEDLAWFDRQIAAG